LTTAFVLPGLNSLLNPKARTRFLGVPEVQSRLRATEAFFQEQQNQKLNFNELLSFPTEKLYSRPHISSAAAGIISMQMGIADLLTKQIGKPAWVVGCSLGDLARTVIAGCCSFESALTMPLITPQNEPGINEIGPNVAIMTSESRPFTEQDISRIQALDIEVSLLSPRLINAAGRFSDIERLSVIAKESKWRVLTLIDYPVHSRLLTQHMKSFLGKIREISFGSPNSSVKIFSTLLRKEILTKSELQFEMENNLVRPHHWHESIDELVTRHNVTDFVNVGPCQTLSKLLRQFPAQIKVIEPEEIIAIA
jgi:[acyl-carrier-protein] S-malonyltransferase